jgi:hypothetical protein
MAPEPVSHQAVVIRPDGTMATELRSRLITQAAQGRRLGWLVVVVEHLHGCPTTMEGGHLHMPRVEKLLLGAVATEVEAPMAELAIEPLRKFTPSHCPHILLMFSSWNPSSRTPYIADSERSAWDAGSKTPGRLTGLESWGADSSNNSSTTARTPGAYNAASPEFLAPAYGSNKELTAPTPGNPLSAPTPSAPTPGPISAPTPGGWDADTAPTPGASSGYKGFSASTPGGWDDEDDAPRYAPPSP